MIRTKERSTSLSESIPRESGDDPIKIRDIRPSSWYSPRERG